MLDCEEAERLGVAQGIADARSAAPGAGRDGVETEPAVAMLPDLGDDDRERGLLGGRELFEHVRRESPTPGHATAAGDGLGRIARPLGAARREQGVRPAEAALGRPGGPYGSSDGDLLQEGVRLVVGERAGS